MGRNHDKYCDFVYIVMYCIPVNVFFSFKSLPQYVEVIGVL